MRIAKNLAHHKIAVLLIVALLAVQAFCDLSLPRYTSDIVDVGIQQSGVEHASATQLSERTHDLVEMMLPESDEQLFAEAYDKAASGDYTLTEAGYEQREDLDEAMALPLSVVYYADQIPDLDLDQVKAAFDAGLVSKDDVMSMLDESRESMGDMADTLIAQQGIAAARAEYEQLGVDMDAMQMDYLFSTGAKMLMLSALGMRLAAERMREYLQGYQSVCPLTHTELALFPAVLRSQLLSALAEHCRKLSSSSSPDALTDGFAALFSSLRAMAELDQRAFLRSADLAEAELMADPAGVYPRMDDESRDSYRARLSRLAAKNGLEEHVFARQLIEKCREESQKHVQPYIRRTAPPFVGCGQKIITDVPLRTFTLAAFFIGEYLETGKWVFTNIADCNEGMTMAFLTMSMAEIFHSLNMRSQRGSLFTMGSRNWALLVSSFAALLLTTLVCEVPFIAAAFDFTSVEFNEYIIAIGMGFLVIPIVEIVKFFQRLAAKKKVGQN